MNQRVRPIAIASLCALAGLGVGYQAGKLLTLREMAEFTGAAQEILEDRTEAETGIRMHELELLQAGKTATVLGLDCYLLRGDVHALEKISSAERAAKIRELHDSAQAKLAELEAAGLCRPAAHPAEASPK